MELFKKIIALRAVWLGIGAAVGAVFGDKAGDAVTTVGTIISSVI